MGLTEHLQSPQFTDADGNVTEEPWLKVGGTWVRPGEPRWKGYALYLTSLIGGVVLVLTTGQGGLDLIAIVGLIFVAVGAYGLVEVWRGIPFRRPW